MDALPRVVLHVDARDADVPEGAIHHDIDVAVLRQRLVVLRDLVPLGQVRIKVVLARETRLRVDAAVQRQRTLDGQFHRLAAQHGQRSGQPQANGAHVGIGRRAKTGRAPAKDLGRGGKLHVHFEADDRLIARNRFGCRHGGGGRGHGVFLL